MKSIFSIFFLIFLASYLYSQSTWDAIDRALVKSYYRWDGYGFSNNELGTTYIIKPKNKGIKKVIYPKNYLSGDSLTFYKYPNDECEGKLIETKICYNQIHGLIYTYYNPEIDFCKNIENRYFISENYFSDINYLYENPDTKLYYKDYNKQKKEFPVTKLTNLTYVNIYTDAAKDFNKIKNLLSLPKVSNNESTENFVCNDDCSLSNSSFYFPYSHLEKNPVFITYADSLSMSNHISYLSSTNLFYLPYYFNETKISNFAYFPSNTNWDDLLAFDLTPLYTSIKPAYLTEENLTKKVNDLRFFQNALLRQKFNLKYSSTDSINSILIKKEKIMNIPKIDTLKQSFAVKINNMTTINIDNGLLNGTISFWASKHCCPRAEYNASKYWLKAGKIEAEINYVDDRGKSYNQIKQNYSYHFCFRNTEFSEKPLFGFIRSDSLYYEFSYTDQFEFIFHSVYYYKKNISIVKVEYDEKQVREKNAIQTSHTLSKIHLRDCNNKIQIITDSNPEFKKYFDLLNTLKIDFVCY